MRMRLLPNRAEGAALYNDEPVLCCLSESQHREDLNDPPVNPVLLSTTISREAGSASVDELRSRAVPLPSGLPQAGCIDEGPQLRQCAHRDGRSP
jgi:hypothetical protein